MVTLDGQEVLGSVLLSGSPSSVVGRKRLFVGGGIAYVVDRRGYKTVDVRNPSQPTVLAADQTAQFGWKNIVTNGSGTGVAAVSPNSTRDGAHHVSVYDVSDPAQNQQFLAEFSTPGRATSVSIYNAIAYVADGDAGLLAVRYLEPDTGTNAPSVTASTNFADGRAEEGQWMRFTSEVSDDVEVRNVQLFIDDALVGTDGNFPFELRFLTPLIADGSPTFTAQMRATDTAGNVTDSELLTITLTEDATPPRTTRFSPADGSFLGGTENIVLTFNEPVDPLSVNRETVQLTRDGQTISHGILSLQPDGLTAVITFSEKLADGNYRVSINGITDLTGNAVEAFDFEFEIGEITINAEFGTPRDSFQSSANVFQVILLESRDLTAESVVTFPTRSRTGVRGERQVQFDSGTTGTITVPADACTGVMALPDGRTLLLQIVPRVSLIDGGQGQQTDVWGSGFIEGNTTVRFGSTAAVVDGGPASDDGIDVFDWNHANQRLSVTVPNNASLPYEVITDGGSSGVVGDLTEITTVSNTGTAVNPDAGSANVGQEVTLTGHGFTSDTRVTLEAMNRSGVPYITTIEPTDVDPAGSSLTFTVPPEARTGMASLLSGGSGVPLQIVPWIGTIDGGRGRETQIRGSGFIEGQTSIRFGSDDVVVTDNGPASDDGIDVFDWSFANQRLEVIVPENAALPYEIITEGGSSGRVTDVTMVQASSDTGTARTPAAASANVGQVVTFQGTGYVEGTTMVVLEAMNRSGVPYITTINPDSITPDGQSLTFTVPPEARTGIATLLSGGSGQLLQIVPWISTIDGGRGRETQIWGSGFIEGEISVRFGSNDVTVTDGGPASDDGIDVFDWSFANQRLEIDVPINATLPYEIITEGGSSGRVTDVAQVTARALSGTPHNQGSASANAFQSVTFQGAGFTESSTKVVLEAMNRSGAPYITTIDPSSITPDGNSLTFVVPAESCTGVATLLSGGSGQLLQIVPTITTIDGGRGQETQIWGSGFTEGEISVQFGPDSDSPTVTDGGSGADDGIDAFDWSFANQRLEVTVPSNAQLPYRIVTEGGISGSDADITAFTSTATSGVAAMSTSASTNIGQTITLTGVGFSAETTKLTFEANWLDGVPYVFTTNPTSVAADGRSLTVEVPAGVVTGNLALLSGGAAYRLQIVPTITSISGTVAPGNDVTVIGSGYSEGDTTVRFGNASVVDGGPETNDGVDVFNWSIRNERLNTNVPAVGGLPVSVTTDGGTSASFTP